MLLEGKDHIPPTLNKPLFNAFPSVVNTHSTLRL